MILSTINLLIIIIPAADLLLSAFGNHPTDLGDQLGGNLLIVDRLDRQRTWRINGNH